MLWRPPSSTLTDTLFPAPTLFRSPAEPDCTRGQGEPHLPDAERLQLVAEAAPRLTGMMRDGQRDRDGREREHARHDDERGAPAHLLAEKRSEEHPSALQSLMRISYAVFCLKKKKATQR